MKVLALAAKPTNSADGPAMSILLDEQIDVRMKTALPNFPVVTVLDKGWLGVKNGTLRERLNQENFRLFCNGG